MSRSSGACALLAFGLAACAAPEEPAVRDDVVAADVERRRVYAPSAENPPTAPATRETAAAPPHGDVEATVAELLAQPLDGESALRLALLRNATVRARYERLGAARAEIAAASRLRNPMIDVSTVFVDGGVDLELDLLQPLFSLFDAALRRELAAAEARRAGAAVRRDLVRLAFDVRRAVLRAAVADDLVRLEREDVALAEDALSLRRKLAAAGNIVAQDVTEAELTVAEARLRAAAAAAEAATAREALNALLGLHGAEAARWKLAPRPTPTPRRAAPEARTSDGADETLAVAESLDLAEKQAELDATWRAADAEARAAAFGDAALGARIVRGVDGDAGVGPAATIPLPVFDDGSAVRARGAADLRRLVAERTALGVEIRAAARALAAKRRAAEDEAAFVAETLRPLAHRRTLEVLQQYNAMQIGAFDVLAARRDERSVEKRASRLAYAAERARLDEAELRAGVLRRDVAFGASAPAAEEAAPEPRKGH